jgi:hypothetical protein
MHVFAALFEHFQGLLRPENSVLAAAKKLPATAARSGFGKDPSGSRMQPGAASLA